MRLSGMLRRRCAPCNQVAKDMIAVPIGPDLRLPTHSGLYAWEFAKGRQGLNVHVDGQMTFNSSPPMLRAALGGFGIACLPEDISWRASSPGSERQHLTPLCRDCQRPQPTALVRVPRY